MRFKLIALDIDGTLYNDEKAISPRTREAVCAAQRRGAIVSLTSGRPQSGLEAIGREIELERHHGLLVSHNGGRVVDAESREVLYERPLPVELARRFIRHAATFPVAPVVDDDRVIITDLPDAYRVAEEARAVDLGLRVVDTLADALDFPPVKVLVIGEPDKLAASKSAITDPFLDEIAFTLSAPFYLEANMRGVSKGETLAMVCARLGIAPHEVIAFGDAQNDVTMLQFAGLGVAMGNASDTIKAVADQVTLSNNEDGVAAVLETWFA